MPWRLFWAYFVGLPLLSASLSFATRTQVRLSGLPVFGNHDVSFVAMVPYPASLSPTPENRIAWVIVIREMSSRRSLDSCGGKRRARAGQSKLITVGRV